MDAARLLVSYLFCFVLLTALVSESSCGEYHEQSYPNYEAKQYEYHHHEYHQPPPPKKAAHVDINIPIDLGTIAKLGIVGITQLKLLMALGKVATAGLGVGALGLGSLGKLALSVAPAKKSIAIDLKPPQLHERKYHQYETHHYPEKRQQQHGQHY